VEIIKQGIWAVPGLCLFLAAWQGFNRPPTNRSSTTFVLFYFGMLIYFTLLLAIWGFVFLMMPRDRLAGSIGNPQMSALILAIVAALMVVLASKFERVKKLDAAARQFCVHIAAIPRLADQLGMALASRADFELASSRLRAEVSGLITENIGPGALNFANDGSPSSRFTRAVSLYWLFVAPYNNGTPLEFPASASGKTHYAKMMQLSTKIISQANSHYTALMEIGLAYFTSARPTRQMEDTLRKEAQETANFVCSLIARYVLFQEKTGNQRQTRLSRLGFDSYEDAASFGIDRLITSILAILIITLIIIIGTPRSVSINNGDAFLRSTIFAIQIGLSILAGTFVARRFLQRDDGTGVRFPPIYELTLAGLIVAAISSALKIAAPLIPTLFKAGSFDASISDFASRWSGVLFPFISTLSIGLMCSYLFTLQWNRLRLVLVGAICNGLAFVCTAYLVGLLLPETVLREFNEDLGAAKLKIVLTSGIVGAGVGAMVLAMFKRNARAGKAGVSTQTSPLDLDRQDGNPPRGTYADRPLGGYSRESVGELEGSYVCFRPTFANPDIINAYIMRLHWDVKQSCLVFEEEARADSAYTQRGRICVPEGKPFIHFVTMDRGAVRVSTVSRPDGQSGLAQGLILTLSNPRGMHFTPATAPVVMRRLGEELPHLGYVHPGTPDYDLYRAHLLSVFPDYGQFAGPQGPMPRDGLRIVA
jgi:hypothetical protein